MCIGKWNTSENRVYGEADNTLVLWSHSKLQLLKLGQLERKA